MAESKNLLLKAGPSLIIFRSFGENTIAYIFPAICEAELYSTPFKTAVLLLLTVIIHSCSRPSSKKFIVILELRAPNLTSSQSFEPRKLFAPVKHHNASSKLVFPCALCPAITLSPSLNSIVSDK